MKRPKKGKAGKARRCVASRRAAKRRAAKRRADRRRTTRNSASESPQKSYDLVYMFSGGKRVPKNKIFRKLSDKLEKAEEVHWVEQRYNQGNTIGFLVDNTSCNRKKTKVGAACESCVELKKTIIQLQDELLEAQGKYLSLLEKVGDI